MKKFIFILIIIITIIIVLYLKIFQHYTPGRPKGYNAAVKANMANVRAQSKLIYDENTPHSFEMVCNNALVRQSLKNIEENFGKTVKCFNDIDSYVVTAQFKKPETDGSTYYCTDSDGNLRGITYEKDISIFNANTLCS